MSQPVVIRCDEVAADPVCVALGDVLVDIAKISAYHTIRMLKVLQDISAGDADPTEATHVVEEMVLEQNPGLVRDDILKAGNQIQLNHFITTLTGYVLKTYAPLREASRFFPGPARKTAPGKEST